MTGNNETADVNDALQEAALDWFLRLREADGSDPALLADFGRWRIADSRHAAAYRQIERVWSDPDLESALDGLGVAAASPQGPWRPRYALAAGSVLLLGLCWTLLAALLPRADFRTAVGERETARLADGSVARLDTDSALQVDYSSQQREVRLLQGRAHFDVTRDVSRPFVVEAGEVRVQVLGTHFDVWRQDGAVGVSVESGHVRVAAAQGGMAELRDAEQLWVKQGRPGVIGTFDPDLGSAWQRGRLAFVDQPLGDVLQQLQRYRGGHLWILDSGLAARHVSGDYRLDSPDRVVDALAAVVDARVTRLFGGRVVLLRPAPAN